MVPVIQAVLRLQGLDLRAAELRKEILSLPKYIAHIEKALDSHLRKLDVDRAALAANHRDRKKYDDDIKVQEQKMSKLREQMMQAKTNDQYRAFQHEIEYCQQEIRKAEDHILDLMGESEPLEKNVKTAEAALKLEKEQVEKEQHRARERTAVDQKFLDDALRDRGEVVSGLDARTLSDYERIRKKWNGVAIAEATSGRCSACHIVLRPQFFQDLKRGEKVLHCESCGRIIYYNPPVNLEHEMHQQPASS